MFPFEAVARHSSGGWHVFEVARGRAMPYTSGSVVLPDGRLLTLIEVWSSDRNGELGPQHHGLWVSAGDDWSRYRPYRNDRFRDLLREQYD